MTLPDLFNFNYLILFKNAFLLNDWLQKLIAYSSVACILVFITAYALGLGPIPFIYVAESFGQNERASAMSAAVFINWLSAFILTSAFPLMQDALEQNVFFIFSAVIFIALLVIIKKVFDCLN